jgi:hypothetical protein
MIDMTMHLRCALCATAAFVLGPMLASAQSEDTKAWLQDLDVLARELPRRHMAPATERPVAAFAADVERVKSRIALMAREEIVLEFARLAASFGDSHTELSLGQPRVGFHRFPLGLYFFGNDLRVVAVDEGHPDLLGSRLVAIGDHPIVEVLDRIEPIIADDFGNPGELLHSGPAFLVIPEVLIGLGLASRNQPVRYVFERDNGQRVTESFTSGSFQGAAESMTARLLKEDSAPLFARRRHLWYALDQVQSTDVLYVRVNRSQDQSGRDSLGTFTRRVEEAIRRGGVRSVAVDLRVNTGGNFHKTEPLADALCRLTDAGAVQRVYVILGRHTYSAAIVLAAQLKHGCGALFVGEVPRAVPNRQADVETFTLPSSKLEVTYSAKPRRPFPELGNAIAIPLDIPAPWTWESYRTGRDPALEAILRFASPTRR